MKKCFSKGKPLYMPYTLRLLTAMMLITLLVATIIGVALCKLAISSIRNMESSLTQKNMEIVAQNMNRALNSVDEFCVEVVTSKYVQDICQNRLPIESVETAIANLEDYLETSVRVGTDSYGIEFNFVNIYLKDGTHNIIQFDALPFSNFEECSEYYIEQGTIDAGRYTPMTWLDSVKLRDRSGKMVNSLIWIRYLYDAITMEKVGIMVGGVSEDTFKDIFEIFPQAYLCHSSGKILSSTDTELFQSCIPKTIKDNVLSSHLSVDSFKYENITHRLCFWKESYYSLILIVPHNLTPS